VNRLFSGFSTEATAVRTVAAGNSSIAHWLAICGQHTGKQNHLS